MAGIVFRNIAKESSARLGFADPEPEIRSALPTHRNCVEAWQSRRRIADGQVLVAAQEKVT
jgi:hypothetical protein